jgi:hypothetical protein
LRVVFPRGPENARKTVGFFVMYNFHEDASGFLSARAAERTT